MRRAQLVIGQSHVAAWRDAARARRERDPDRLRTRVIHLGEPRWQGEAAGAFSAPLVAGIRDQIDRHDPLVASVIGGNAHNTLALLRHPRRYDLHLDGDGGPPIDPEAEPVPVALVRAALSDAMATDLARMAALRAIAGPFVQIESPPPVRDDEFILARADAFFVENGIAAIGVAPAGLRYRIWRLASAIVAEQAARLGCRYLPVPKEACDTDGFLPATFAGDATHGNAAYGEIMIRTLDAL